MLRSARGVLTHIWVLVTSYSAFIVLNLSSGGVGISHHMMKYELHNEERMLEQRTLLQSNDSNDVLLSKQDVNDAGSKKDCTENACNTVHSNVKKGCEKVVGCSSEEKSSQKETGGGSSHSDHKNSEDNAGNGDIKNGELNSKLKDGNKCDDGTTICGSGTKNKDKRKIEKVTTSENSSNTSSNTSSEDGKSPSTSFTPVLGENNEQVEKNSKLDEIEEANKKADQEQMTQEDLEKQRIDQGIEHIQIDDEVRYANGQIASTTRTRNRHLANGHRDSNNGHHLANGVLNNTSTNKNEVTSATGSTEGSSAAGTTTHGAHGQLMDDALLDHQGDALEGMDVNAWNKHIAEEHNNVDAAAEDGGTTWGNGDWDDEEDSDRKKRRSRRQQHHSVDHHLNSAKGVIQQDVINEIFRNAKAELQKEEKKRPKASAGGSTAQKGKKEVTGATEVEKVRNAPPAQQPPVIVNVNTTGTKTSDENEESSNGEKSSSGTTSDHHGTTSSEGTNNNSEKRNHKEKEKNLSDVEEEKIDARIGRTLHMMPSADQGHSDDDEERAHIGRREYLRSHTRRIRNHIIAEMPDLRDVQSVNNTSGEFWRLLVFWTLVLSIIRVISLEICPDSWFGGVNMVRAIQRFQIRRSHNQLHPESPMSLDDEFPQHHGLFRGAVKAFSDIGETVSAGIGRAGMQSNNGLEGPSLESGPVLPGGTRPAQYASSHIEWGTMLAFCCHDRPIRGRIGWCCGNAIPCWISEDDIRRQEMCIIYGAPCNLLCCPCDFLGLARPIWYIMNKINMLWTLTNPLLYFNVEHNKCALCCAAFTPALLMKETVKMMSGGQYRNRLNWQDIIGNGLQNPCGICCFEVTQSCLTICEGCGEYNPILFMLTKCNSKYAHLYQNSGIQREQTLD